MIMTRESAPLLVDSSYSANLIKADSTSAVTTFGAGGFFIGRNTLLTGLSNLGSNAQTMLVQGEGTSNNDVTQNLSIIELCQQ